MAYITAPDFRMKGIEWELDRPSQVNVSAYTARRSVLQNPWHGRWRAKVELATLQGESAFNSIRGFFARCKGQVNVFPVYATVETQHAGSNPQAYAAASGATSLTLASSPALTGGMLASVELSDGGRQLVVLTGDISGSVITFEPPLRNSVLDGAEVNTTRPVCLVSMTNSQIGWSIGSARRFGVGFSVEEAIPNDVSDGYALFLDFTNSLYRVGSTKTSTLSSVAGYAYTRSGAKSELNFSGSPVAYAANAPAVINGVGYWARLVLTNQLLESQTFDAASWTKTNCAITANTTAAPDGATTADTLTASAITGVAKITQAYGSGAASTAYTQTIFAKAGAHRYLWLGDRGDAVFHSATFDLQDGTVVGTTNSSGYIQSSGSGWYRCTITLTRTNAGAVSMDCALGAAAHSADHPSATYAGTETVRIWQAQLLVANLPDGGPLIATTTATATVGADDLSVTDTASSGDQIFMATANLPALLSSGAHYLAAFSDGTTNNRVELAIASTAPQVTVTSGGVSQLSQTGSAVTAGRITVFAVRSGGNWRGGYVKDGVLTWLGAATAGSFPSGLNKASPGQQAVATNQAGGKIERVIRKAGTFSDADIIAMAA